MRLVPPLAAGECQVWWADASASHGLLAAAGGENAGAAATAAVGLLDARERTHWQRLRNPAGRALYLTAHVLARLVLGAQLRLPPAELAFDAECARCGGPHGKPRLAERAGRAGRAGPESTAGWEFSLSHTPHRVAVAMARRTPLGVDVERVRDRAAATVARTLSEREYATLNARPAHCRAGDFARYWARKEAALKATGDGLAVRPDLLTVSGPDAPAALLGWSGPQAPHSTVHLVDLAPGTGYRACLGVLAEADATPRVTEHDAGALLRASLPA
ncbi:4-phosphopantetheinyl transferase [Streptomyces armeniacus]|uniref:4-phosphopantetheinyl transferase n=1 Tax=Streptomyces armeniacus TaxID=83291 RepID=A0A345XPI5_9ACTN|nr:4'-phosphopantetheinyl transferase superfamily protein [Streptomyces armeniacus]AXK33551.1 4-phosphopantetheinyl transferase [Streptomyces armeniacus]